MNVSRWFMVARTGWGLAVLVIVLLLAGQCLADSWPWRSDYARAKEEASAARKMLFVVFHDASKDGPLAPLETALAEVGKTAKLKDQHVFARLTPAASVELDGKPVRLLETAEFQHLDLSSGLALVDFRDPKANHFGQVVSIYPFREPRLIPREHLAALVALPPGSLTQRTLIFAVRVHPEGPQSTASECSPMLAEEAESHAHYQAQIGVQGHHHWSHRFERIIARLPGRLLAQEVCAESWPGQGLYDAAVECVHSWRQSPGHWDAVRTRHALYGYDMKRGRNGIWYATGIFGRQGW